MKKTVILMGIVAFSIVLFAGVALAQDGEKLDTGVKSMIALSCGLGIAIAAFGGALAQGRAAAAAIEGIARNPGAYNKVFTPMILGLALIESLVIYSLLISLILVFKL
ncbi:MAG: ATP synthase F0 subunit C [Candidatus Lernaella stagnicola]|nr:ATP synthase F0 subunit C [Candidatus Lernaella stagnicola]